MRTKHPQKTHYAFIKKDAILTRKGKVVTDTGNGHSSTFESVRKAKRYMRVG